jgi:hypothetical protein
MKLLPCNEKPPGPCAGRAVVRSQILMSATCPSRRALPACRSRPLRCRPWAAQPQAPAAAGSAGRSKPTSWVSCGLSRGVAFMFNDRPLGSQEQRVSAVASPMVRYAMSARRSPTSHSGLSTPWRTSVNR